MKRFLLVTLLVVFSLIGAVSVALAKPDYISKLPADKASAGCNACHSSIPALNSDGEAFKSAGNTWPAPKAAAPAPVKSETSTPAAPAAKPAATAPAAKPAAPAVTTVNVKLEILGKASQLQGRKDGDKVLIQARAAAEALGATLTDWDNKAKKATVAYGGKNFSYQAKVFGTTGYVDTTTLANDLSASFDAKNLVLARSKSQVVSAQWSTSPHDIASWGELTETSPVNRNNCIACHDGQGFANNKTLRADLPEAVRNTPNAIGCNSCHSDRGKEIRNSGQTPKLANGYQVKGAGAGALCISCHNGRKLPDPEKTPAPHRGTQSDVLFGSVGAKVAGFSYPSSPHAANPNTCTSCHMGKNDGVKNHTFEVIDSPEYVAGTCGNCHQGLTTVNRTALADYDGNKVVEGIQDEVKGLMAILEKAIKAKEVELGVTGGESHGSFAWTDASGQPAKVPATLYNASYNLVMVENDGSHGVHNPAYVVSLLQQSYKDLTGKDVPNAALR